ncbi:mitochondrial import inner membrane translocase subunit TIM50-C-like [Oratosquilla oratoria]|uniref:mitochondrial import inner membrane translocase subunit TIM50-C-like n=1 Tax=Oratosquilla oratoria TaxID=337810 RepID=UPI003F75DAB3
MAAQRICLLLRNRPKLLQISGASPKITYSFDIRQLRTVTWHNRQNSVLSNYKIQRKQIPVYGFAHSKLKTAVLSTNEYCTKQDSTSSKQSIGLADQLLSSKVQSEGKDGKSESESEKEEHERKWRAMKFSFIFFGVMMSGMGTFLIYSWGAPDIGPDGESMVDEFSGMPIIQQYLQRTWREAMNMDKMIKEPSREKLLPEVLQEPYIQPPYTLVLELKDVLVHPEWTYETGWRFKKRPGVDFLLHHCAPPLFEIVIYTSEQGFTAFPIIDHLDPNGYIWYRLFKDSTRYVEGKHLKDLACLNRDLKKVIMIDWDEDAITSTQNHLKLKRWDGQMDDHTLIDLGIMLRTIAESEVEDVREVLSYYRNFQDPLEQFKENQRAAQEQEAISRKRTEEELKTGGLKMSWAANLLKWR